MGMQDVWQVAQSMPARRVGMRLQSGYSSVDHSPGTAIASVTRQHGAALLTEYGVAGR
jgi:hypothetical protein